MNQEWSDTESSEDEDELIQPNRDFPISDDENSDEEYEDEEFDIYELAKKTANKTMTDDLFVKEEKTIVEKHISNSINKPISNILQKTEQIKPKEKRKFNPRLPPPNKYNKINDNKFKLNLKDFPTL